MMNETTGAVWFGSRAGIDFLTLARQYPSAKLVYADGSGAFFIKKIDLKVMHISFDCCLQRIKSFLRHKK